MKDNFDFDSCVELFVTTERGPLLICSFVLLLKKKTIASYTFPSSLWQWCSASHFSGTDKMIQLVLTWVYVGGELAHPCVIFKLPHKIQFISY